MCPLSHLFIEDIVIVNLNLINWYVFESIDARDLGQA